MAAGRGCRRRGPAGTRAPGARRPRACGRASRSSSVSPTQTMGVSPAAQGRRDLLRRRRRRSRRSAAAARCGPTMTQVQPGVDQHRRADLAGEGARVLRVDVLRRRPRPRLPSHSCAHAASAVKGGAMTMSTCGALGARRTTLGRRARRRGAAVVHLPVAGDERASLRVHDASPPRRTSMPGQLLPLDELERRAAARRDVLHLRRDVRRPPRAPPPRCRRRRRR